MDRFCSATPIAWGESGDRDSHCPLRQDDDDGQSPRTQDPGHVRAPPAEEAPLPRTLPAAPLNVLAPMLVRPHRPSVQWYPYRNPYQQPYGHPPPPPTHVAPVVVPPPRRDFSYGIAWALVIISTCSICCCVGLIVFGALASVRQTEYDVSYYYDTTENYWPNNKG